MKKTPIISLFTAAALLGFCGCASDHPNQSQSAEPAPAKPAKDTRPKEDRLQVGMSKEDVRTAIGNPRGVSVSSDGSEIWTYDDREKAFIPNYSLFGGKFHNIVVIFGADGKVKSWNTSASGGY